MLFNLVHVIYLLFKRNVRCVKNVSSFWNNTDFFSYLLGSTGWSAMSCKLGEDTEIIPVNFFSSDVLLLF